MIQTGSIQIPVTASYVRTIGPFLKDRRTLLYFHWSSQIRCEKNTRKRTSGVTMISLVIPIGVGNYRLSPLRAHQTLFAHALPNTSLQRSSSYEVPPFSSEVLNLLRPPTTWAPQLSTCTTYCRTFYWLLVSSDIKFGSYLPNPNWELLVLQSLYRDAVFEPAPGLHSDFEERFHATRALWKNFAIAINWDETIFNVRQSRFRLRMMQGWLRS